ncbi:hypothetical membrane spanning protein [Mycoplasmopsis fermentans JER]|nr:hypothetical membrane spanning protein [Mycoplasmopsis fermentans JER]
MIFITAALKISQNFNKIYTKSKLLYAIIISLFCPKTTFLIIFITFNVQCNICNWYNRLDKVKANDTCYWSDKQRSQGNHPEDLLAIVERFLQYLNISIFFSNNFYYENLSFHSYIKSKKIVKTLNEYEEPIVFL